ncbi:hypothetical protein ABPG72_016597 [Tetrahymena utriculariae]
MMQEHSNRPQFFQMKGETLIICESKQSNKFLTQIENGKYAVPSKFLGNKDDFVTAIQSFLSQKYSKLIDDFELIGFIKMESQIIEKTYEQYIRNVFYVRYYGDDSKIADFKTAEEISANCTDQSFINYINYIKNGGIAYPLQIFAYEGSQVELPQFKTPFQKQKMQEYIQQQKNTV